MSFLSFLTPILFIFSLFPLVTSSLNYEERGTVAHSEWDNTGVYSTVA